MLNLCSLELLIYKILISLMFLFKDFFFFSQTKVVPSRSGSTQSFDEALRESEAMRRASAAPSATSPTIPEDKMLSQSSKSARFLRAIQNADTALYYYCVRLLQSLQRAKWRIRARRIRFESFDTSLNRDFGREQSSKYYPILYSIKKYIFLARHFHAFLLAGSPFFGPLSGHPLRKVSPTRFLYLILKNGYSRQSVFFPNNEMPLEFFFIIVICKYNKIYLGSNESCLFMCAARGT